MLLLAAASFVLPVLACAQARAAVVRSERGWDDHLALAVLAQNAADSKSAEAKSAETKPGAPKSTETVAKKPEASPGGTAAVVLDVNAVDSVIGVPVKSSGNEDMGHIVDILVTPNGDIRAAVIDFGGVLGVGSRKVAVDWRTLKFSGEGRSGPAILALSRNQVRVAPEYKPGDPVVVLEPPKAEETKPPKTEPKGAGAPASAPAGGIKP
ncbi:MAG: PRC-barrel domain-containing protein [Acetobacteraceae bacterium]|nr:PRC-barrel domain-containing protein [Acetobacteraceae bacterium]